MGYPYNRSEDLIAQIEYHFRKDIRPHSVARLRELVDVIVDGCSGLAHDAGETDLAKKIRDEFFPRERSR